MARAVKPRVPWAAAYNPQRKRLPGWPSSCAGFGQRFEPALFVNLLKAASTVSLLTLLSRVTGLVREQMIAALFGAGAATDAFNVAFRIPNLFRRLFAEGAFSQAFVPLLAATRARDGDEATRDLVHAVATVLAWVMLVVCALGVVGAPVLVWLIGSGLKDFEAAVLMTRWMFPYIGLMSMVALSAGILNTWRRFAVPAVTPVLLNLSVIAAAWWGAPRLEAWGLQPILALAGGVMLGGLLQLAMQCRRWPPWVACRASAWRRQPSPAPGATLACARCCARWRLRCSAYPWRRSLCSSTPRSPRMSRWVRFRGSVMPIA
jgi:O-antigen/teichoic acid export membrane protein